jgi:hypothetical protein
MVTNFSTSSALRPGYCVITLISVLVTSGNASMGISLKVITPKIINTTEAAKMKYLFISEKAITLFNIFIMVLYLKVAINY